MPFDLCKGFAVGSSGATISRRGSRFLSETGGVRLARLMHLGPRIDLRVRSKKKVCDD